MSFLTIGDDPFELRVRLTTPEALRELGQCLKLGGTAVQIKKRTRAGVGVICLIGAIHVHDSALTQGVGLPRGSWAEALWARHRRVATAAARTGCQSPQEGEGRPPADPLLELGVVCTVGYKVAAVVEGLSGRGRCSRCPAGKWNRRRSDPGSSCRQGNGGCHRVGAGRSGGPALSGRVGWLRQRGRWDNWRIRSE